MKTIEELRSVLAEHGKPPFPTFIDNSQVTTFLACETKWKYEYLYKLQKHESVHLVAGGAYAAGLEAVRLAFFHKNLPAEECLAIGASVLLKTYAMFECPEKIAKTPWRMVEALDYYTKIWHPATDHLRPIQLGNQSGIEFSFAIPLEDCIHPETGEPILYTGRCDMIGARSSGAIFIEDDKTTGSMGPTWVNQWLLASQFSGYVWAARQFLEKVTGAVVRGIAIKKNDFAHGEVLAYRKPWEIDRWRHNLSTVIERMKIAWAADDYLYNLDKTCNSFGSCQFMDLCDSQYPEKWYDNYTINTWSPLD